MTESRVSGPWIVRILAGACIVAGAASATGAEAAGPTVPDDYLPELVLVPAGEMVVVDPDGHTRAGRRGGGPPCRLRAALPDRQVRDHVRAVGFLPPGRWLLPSSERQGVGARGPSRHRRKLGRCRPVSRLAVTVDRRALPPADRRRVGIRGARGRGTACQASAPLHGRGSGVGRQTIRLPPDNRRRRSRQAHGKRTRSASSTRRATSGSGPTAAGSSPTRRKMAGSCERTAASGSCRASTGATCRLSSARRPRAAARSNPCPAISAFGWFGSPSPNPDRRVQSLKRSPDATEVGPPPWPRKSASAPAPA